MSNSISKLARCEIPTCPDFPVAVESHRRACVEGIAASVPGSSQPLLAKGLPASPADPFDVAFSRLDPAIIQRIPLNLPPQCCCTPFSEIQKSAKVILSHLDFRYTASLGAALYRLIVGGTLVFLAGLSRLRLRVELPL
jgi:hypothetical protein